MKEPPFPGLASADALIGVDEGLRVVFWNRAAELLTGLAEAEVLGGACWEAVGGVDELEEPLCRADCVVARRAFAGGEVPAAAVSIRTTAGRRRALLSTLTARCGDGRPLLLHVVQRDAESARPLRNSNHHRRRREPAAPRMTHRQQEVLQLLAQGLSTRAIAERLTLSPPTVRNHVAGLLRAFGCHSRVELLAQAHGLRLV